MAYAFENQNVYFVGGVRHGDWIARREEMPNSVDVLIHTWGLYSRERYELRLLRDRAGLLAFYVLADLSKEESLRLARNLLPSIRPPAPVPSS